MKFYTQAQLSAQALGLRADAGLMFAQTAHLLPLTLADVALAVCDFPVLVSRNSADGRLMLSALSSFVPGHNLLHTAGGWQAVYRPLVMQAYPCYCQPDGADKSYVFAADPRVFSADTAPLFNAQGMPSAQAQQLMQLADQQLEQERQAHYCLQQLQAQRLLRAVELQLYPQSGEPQRIRGLLTIDEDRLHSLPADTLKELQLNGCLALTQSLLNSLLQLNRLIQRHNELAQQDSNRFSRIRQLKIELDRDGGFR